MSASSLALARQYRPRTFQALVGQDHVTQALANALKSGRLHHAYLFTGTRGVGKTTVSRILAKALNCVGPDGSGGPTPEPCGVCNACRDIDAGRFVDYTELDAASNRGVEEIGQLLEQAVYKPVVGRTKVFMIDEVHMLSSHAFNAMLKTLEEPPEYLKFVLATTDPQKVPVTVLSRCLQFNLRPLPPPLVAQHLAAVLQQEKVPAEPAALQLLGRAARGSMRDALSLTDQAIAFGSGRVDAAQVQQMLGSTPRAHVLALLDALGAADGAALVAEVDRLRAAGHPAQGVADELARWLQQLALAQVAPQALSADDPDHEDTLQRAALLPADELQLAYRLMLQAREELPLAPDEHAGLLMLLLRAIAFRPGAVSAPQPAAAPRVAPLRAPAAAMRSVPVAAPPAPPAAKVAAATATATATANEAPPWLDLPAEDSPAAAAMPEAREPEPETGLLLARRPEASAASAAAAETVLTLQPTAEGEAWAALVAELPLVGLARTLALQSQALRLQRDASGWQLQLRCASPALLQGAARLQAVLAERAEQAGVPLQFELNQGPATDTPLLREQHAAQARQREAERRLAESPELALLREHFPTTRVRPSSIRASA